MNGSPFLHEAWLHVGPVEVTGPVVVTWAVMAALTGLSVMITRRLSLEPSRRQAVLEMIVGAIDGQIRETMQTEPGPYRALIGTIFLFVLAANWTSLVPGVEPPTATLETDAALALIVLVAGIWYGIRTQGLGGYLHTFAEPSWVMIPLNVFEQISRTFSMIVRLFGNIMSGVFIVGIVLSLAGLLVPIPLMALELLTGAVQAYIFAVLAMVFIAAAMGGERGDSSGATGPDRNAERRET
jgi:F-type H+-transporting ATPase subunit a